MAYFLTENFLLESALAEKLYYDFAQHQPVIDYHSHLVPEVISSDRKFKNMTEIWLQGDHYKWRAMRTLGIPEHYITGKANDREKFKKWAESVPYTLRNPLFHWTHMELKNPFGLEELLQSENADRIYDITSEKLQEDALSPQGLLTHFNVQMAGTTDDPIDSLEHHLALQKSNFKTKILPSFRPDKIFNIHQGNHFRAYVKQLSEVSNVDIKDMESLLAAYRVRIDFFEKAGCIISDHGLSAIPHQGDMSLNKIETIFKAVLKGDDSQGDEVREPFSFFVLTELCKMYCEKGWVQQFHLGALRNTNTHKLSLLGADTGYDSMGDFHQAETLSHLLNNLEASEKLTQTILYNLNPADNAVFATMIGNFQGEGIRGKIQYGSGWWFLDQWDGMTQQINTLSNMGLISVFIGMLTDSRSLLSYSRHEYFRRLICNLFANDMERGYIPNDINMTGSVIADICFRNAKNYFKL